MMQTPYFLIHKAILDEGVKKLKSALREYWPNARVGYSFKTNSLPWVLEYMKTQDFYAEVVSEDEYNLAEYMGYSHIIYNGPVKGKDSFLRAVSEGHMVNLDAWREIRWLKEMAGSGTQRNVGIRVNFDLESMCPGEASGGEAGGRFGFSYENNDFARAVEEIEKIPGIKLTGIHLHCSSKTRSLNIYRAIAETACRIRRETGLSFSYLDVGGGYFGGLAHKPQYADYIREMAEILKKEYSSDRTALVVEPGTSLICPPVDYVTSVTDVKATNRNCFVVTDGSRIHVDPLMTKKSYFFHIEPSYMGISGTRGGSQIISGFTCMENDRLFELKDGPELQEGDRIVYEKVGAYTMCLSPLFIGYFPPVYLEDGDAIICVRDRWGVQEYVQKSLLDGKEHEYFNSELWNKK